MADENVLSLLITGRSLDALSQQYGNALTSAAISLGVESANKLVQKIGEQRGLKDVAFTSKSGNQGTNTRVDIAAKINDRLNVGYGTSIDSDSSVQAGWNIEYKLSPNISFEAISGDEISTNINYKKQFSSTKDKDKDKDKDKN
jgi:translocation and assembly module TamB